MKKMLKFLILIIMFMLPMFVSAEDKMSEYAVVSSSIKDFELGKIKFSNIAYNRFDNYHATGKKAVTITGNIYNSYSESLNVKTILRLYDKNKIELQRVDSEIDVAADSSAIYRVVIYEEDIDFSLDDIKYYTLSSDMLEEVAILEATASDAYYFSDYDIKINVNLDNVYNVEKNFVANFKNNIGIVEVGIPYRHKYVREDGTKVNKRAIIGNIVVDDYFTISTEEGIRVSKIGKEDKGKKEKKYNISYDYNVGKDSLKDNDEFIFYLVDNTKVRINGVDFEIVLPKNVQKENIKFIDANGIEVENIVYTLNNNVIKGKIDGVVNPDSSYAISILLEDDYFQNCSNNTNGFIVMTIVISIIFVLVSLIIWNINKKLKTKVIYNKILFTENVNSLELGYLYNGIVKDSDIATLILCLANKGYIAIEKNKNIYKIIKKKDYDADDRVERIFMEELFRVRDVVTKKELTGSLKNMRELVEEKLEEHNKKRKIFSHKVFNCRLLFWLMVVVIVILNVISLLMEFQPSVILVNIIFSVLGYLLLLNGVLASEKPIEKMLCALVSLIMIVSVTILTSYKAFFHDNLALISYMLAIVCMLVISVVANSVGKRTGYGNKMLYQIMSYKEYLVKVDDTVINRELEKNKKCYYEVLPYALTLGISDKWIEKFEDKDLLKPSWYIVDKFNIDEFYEDVKNIYSDIFIGLKNNGSKE